MASLYFHPLHLHVLKVQLSGCIYDFSSAQVLITSTIIIIITNNIFIMFRVYSLRFSEFKFLQITFLTILLQSCHISHFSGNIFCLFVLLQSTSTIMNSCLKFVFHSFSEHRQSDGVSQFLFLVFTMFYWGRHIHNSSSSFLCLRRSDPIFRLDEVIDLAVKNSDITHTFFFIFMKSRCFVSL